MGLVVAVEGYFWLGFLLMLDVSALVFPGLAAQLGSVGAGGLVVPGVSGAR